MVIKLDKGIIFQQLTTTAVAKSFKFVMRVLTRDLFARADLCVICY